jgi:hypothetical protein
MLTRPTLEADDARLMRCYPVPVAVCPWLSMSSTLRTSSEGRNGFPRMPAPCSRNSGCQVRYQRPRFRACSRVAWKARPFSPAGQYQSPSLDCAVMSFTQRSASAPSAAQRTENHGVRAPFAEVSKDDALSTIMVTERWRGGSRWSPGAATERLWCVVFPVHPQSVEPESAGICLLRCHEVAPGPSR